MAVNTIINIFMIFAPKKVFNSIVYVHIPLPKTAKLNEKCIPSITLFEPY